MATAAPASERNKVLSITMQAIDKLSPGIKSAQNMLKALKQTAANELQAAFAPFKQFGATIANTLRPTNLLRQSLHALLSPIRLVGEGLNKLMTLPGRLMRAMLNPFRTLRSLLTSLLSPLNLIMGAVTFLAARGVFRFFSEAADDLDVIDDLNRRLSVSIHALQQYRLVAELQGTTLEQLVQSWQQMTNAIGEATQGQGQAAAALRELGLSAHQLRRLAPEKQFEAIRDALSDITNETDRMRLAMDIFGRRRGAELQRIMKITREEFQQLRDEAFLFDYEDLQRVSEFKDSITLIRRTWQDVKTIVAVQFMPLLRNAIEDVRTFIKDNLPQLREGARAVAQHVEFALRATAEFARLFWTLLNDREQTEALGSLMRVTADLFTAQLETTLKAAIKVIFAAFQTFAKPLGAAALTLGEELGDRIVQGTLRALATLPIKLSKWINTNAVAKKFFSSIFGIPEDIFGATAGVMFDTWEAQIDKLFGKAEDGATRVSNAFAKASQDAVSAFEIESEKLLAAGSDFFRESGENVRLFAGALSILGERFPVIGQFVERILAIREAVYAVRDAMLGLKAEPPEPNPKAVSAWEEFFKGFETAARASILTMEQVGSRVFQAFESGMDRMLDSALDGTFRMAEAFRQMGKEVLKVLAKIFAQQAALSIVGAFFPKAVTGGGFGSYQLVQSASAKGNVFAAGNVVPFARGGVVDQPVLFPMRRGAGLMGEAGPEVIMPLTRDGQGRLGVRATGEQQSSGPVNVDVHIHAIDAKGLDRLLVEHKGTLIEIVRQAIHTKSNVRQSIREVR